MSITGERKGQPTKIELVFRILLQVCACISILSALNVEIHLKVNT